jgi:hypothetical protein
MCDTGWHGGDVPPFYFSDDTSRIILSTEAQVSATGGDATQYLVCGTAEMTGAVHGNASAGLPHRVTEDDRACGCRLWEAGVVDEEGVGLNGGVWGVVESWNVVP